jgi:GTPase SAR1 family protein
MRKSFLSDSDDSDESDNEYDIKSKYKIIILGDSKCGKTSFITRLTKDYFTLFYTPTKAIEIYRDCQIGRLRCELWDIPPRVNYHFKLKSLGADGVILMFKANNMNSKDNVMKIWQKMYKQMPSLPYVFLVAVTHARCKDRIPGVHYIDNMSTIGYNELLFHIQKTLKLRG